MLRDRVRRPCPTVQRGTPPASRLRRAGLPCWFLLLILVVAAAPAPSAAADPAGGPEAFRRWGIGWDNGIALRCWLSPTWGLGFNLNPDWQEYETDWGLPPDPGDPLPDWQENSSRSRATTVSLLLFSESRLRPWLRAGPYAALSYAYARDRDVYFDHSAGDWGEGVVISESRSEDLDTDRSWTAEIGIRPSFRLHDRFVLETRLGIRLSRFTSESVAHYTQTVWTETTEETTASEHHDRDKDWRLAALGRDLGPGAALQFVILF